MISWRAIGIDFSKPATRTWIPAKQLAARSAYWQLIRTLLAERATHVLVATRDDYADGLECIRFLSKPRTYRLLPLERGFISQIIGRLTTRKPDEAQVIAEPEHGWTRLRDRLVADLEARGAVLPQQLKVVLGGLRALRNLTLVEYGRAGGLGGLEASFVERSISRAASCKRLGK